MRDTFTSVYIINNDIEALSFIEMRGKIDGHSKQRLSRSSTKRQRNHSELGSRSPMNRQDLLNADTPFKIRQLTLTTTLVEYVAFGGSHCICLSLCQALR